MEPIVCKNNAQSVVSKIQEYIAKDRIIKCIYLVDCSDDQAVILLSESEITERDAKIFWAGFQAALG